MGAMKYKRNSFKLNFTNRNARQGKIWNIPGAGGLFKYKPQAVLLT